MDKKTIRLAAAGLCLLMITAACSLGFMNTEAQIATQVVEAVDAKLGEIEAKIDALGDTADADGGPTAYPTQTPYPTYTPIPTSSVTYSYSYNYSYAIGTPSSCLRAKFISENVPDNTVFSAGENFTKSWTLENTGSCTWTTNFKLAFTSGSRMGGNSTTNLTANVSPGGRVTVSTNLTAPSTAGTYRGDWCIQSDSGSKFGCFWVKIKVQ